MQSSTTLNSSRLGIFHLLAITTGIALAISIGRGIEHLRFPADSYYYGIKEVRQADVVGLLVTSLYGLGVTICFFALRSGNVWQSPGKVLSIIIASMCLLNWGLDAIVSGLVSYRIEFGPSIDQATSGEMHKRGLVWGIWYRSFPATIGYAAALPVMALILFKTTKQAVVWRLAWLGFVFCSTMICADIFWSVTSNLALPISGWYFEIAMGIPSVLILLAFVWTWWKGELDWWTVALSLPGPPLIWIVLVASKLIA